MLRSPWILASHLLFLILLSACAKSDPSPSSSNVYPVSSLTEAQQLASEAQVHCTDPSQCSPSVAMLIGTTTSSAYQCTAFLVASDIVATNSHCVPDDLKVSGSSCAGRVELLFPETGESSEVRVGCAQVLSASTIGSGNSHPDYAFLKLDAPVSRPQIAISRAGLAENQTYDIYKMDPYNNNGVPEAYLHKAHCKSIYGSLLANENNSATSDIQAIADCELIHGNSGSPLLDSNGAAPAIAYAGIDPNQESSLVNSLSDSGVALLDSQIAQMGLATNFACQNLAVAADAIPDACSKKSASASYENDKKSEVNKKIQAQMDERIRTENGLLDPSLEWKIVSVPNKIISTIGVISDNPNSEISLLVPKCVADKEKFLSAEKKDWLGNYPDSSERQIRILAWSLQAGINRYLQLDFKLLEAPENIEQIFQMNYNPRSLDKNAESAIFIGDALGIANKEPLYASSLGLCHSADAAK